MERTLLDFWWIALVRGLVAIVFGVLVLMWPGMSIVAFLILIAAYWIVDGLSSIYFAAKARNWGWPFWGGLISVLAGIAAILAPGIATLSILIVIAIWAIARGLIDIYSAIRYHKLITFEWWLGLSGALSVVFGVLVLRAPAAGALAIATLIAFFAIAIGVLLVIASFRIRGFRNRQRPMGV